MLDRSHRFHGLNALNFTYKSGQVARGSSLSLKYAVNSRRQTYRVSVVVSRKVSKSAVVRNRIRRRVYEAVRSQAATVTQPYDLIFTAFNDDLATMDTAALKLAVVSCLRKAGIVTDRA